MQTLSDLQIIRERKKCTVAESLMKNNCVGSDETELERKKEEWGLGRRRRLEISQEWLSFGPV